MPTPRDLLKIMQPELSRMPRDIIIMPGDTVTSSVDSDQVKINYCDLLVEVKKHANSVTKFINSILPDAAGSRNKQKRSMNTFLKNKCEEMSVTYIDNDRNFMFQDGSCDLSAIQEDATHLSTTGLTRLMSNMSLVTMHILNSRASHRNRQLYAGPQIGRLDNPKWYTQAHVGSRLAKAQGTVLLSIVNNDIVN